MQNMLARHIAWNKSVLKHGLVVHRIEVGPTLEDLPKLDKSGGVLCLIILWTWGLVLFCKIGRTLANQTLQWIRWTRRKSSLQLY